MLLAKLNIIFWNSPVSRTIQGIALCRRGAIIASSGIVKENSSPASPFTEPTSGTSSGIFWLVLEAPWSGSGAFWDTFLRLLLTFRRLWLLSAARCRWLGSEILSRTCPLDPCHFLLQVSLLYQDCSVLIDFLVSFLAGLGCFDFACLGLSTFAFLTLCCHGFPSTGLTLLFILRNLTAKIFILHVTRFCWQPVLGIQDHLGTFEVLC